MPDKTIEEQIDQIFEFSRYWKAEKDAYSFGFLCFMYTNRFTAIEVKIAVLTTCMQLRHFPEVASDYAILRANVAKELIKLGKDPELVLIGL